MRSSTRDHLYSFQKYANADCIYLNLAVRKFSKRVFKKNFDLILFHNIFLSRRWVPEDFQKILKQIEPLKKTKAVKAALLQDEFYRSQDVEKFINEFGIDHVFCSYNVESCRKIFTGVNFEKTRFHKVLTGYLDQDLVEKWSAVSENKNRKIDIGYRATLAPAWWGSHGYLKKQIADVFQKECQKEAVRCDISNEPQKTILGDAWYEFLSDCYWTIGAEGGSSVLDKDGLIEQKGREYRLKNPDASFEDYEQNIFPGEDGAIDDFPMSPRHLEACFTRTAQILIEGDYAGILKPNIHYLPLKKDFSNLNQVIAKISDDDLRKQLVENSYRDVVESGEYFYPKFVEFVMEVTLPGCVLLDQSGFKFFKDFRDQLSWILVAIKWFFKKRKR